MKRIIGIVLSVCLLAGVLSGCGTAKSVEDKKVAYIMQMTNSDIFGVWSDAAEKTANELGMEYEAVFCAGSDEEWKNQVESYASKGYDGLLLSHGGKDYAYSFLKEIMEKYPDLKIVTFDTQFVDENGEEQTIEGVTQFFQQDAMLAELLLQYITDDLYAEKKAAGEKVNILKIWKGPEYISAFDRRQVGYEKYEQEGLINTVETIAPDSLYNAEQAVYEMVKAALPKYQEGEIDAIWCCYDLYAQGVYKALKEGGYDIPLVSVDISDQDIAAMKEENSPWKACATTNWSYNGEFGIRALALEMTGEYDKIIDPMTNKPSGWLELPAEIITQDTLKEGGFDLLNVISPKAEKPDWMLTSDWMK